MDLSRIDHRQSSTSYHHGVWVDIDGWWVRVRAIGLQHRAASAFFAALPEDTRAEALMEALPEFLAEHVVLDWKELTSDGKAVPYTRETAAELFKLHLPLAQAVLDGALKAGGLADEITQDEADRLGNLPPGGTNGARTPGNSRSSSDAPPTVTAFPRSSVDRDSAPPSKLPGNAGST